MVTYQQLKKQAEDCYQQAEVFSAEEKVAERILMLLEAGHNVESTYSCLQHDLQYLLLEGDEVRAGVTRAFIEFIHGEL
ncbi:hypothetical protein [Ktedonobacter robiniae]|uniref:Uncharacterized protein n=1 Tax=Ktedonobacter robiniae TaxID=2778365 RepID=A0ABQ3UJN3_9CHLR|nr:hypothetical protein [Ktedonobacter robiniae]GHO52898.1 hypothetical protein KSB_13730 [Ktedonobacter robiniae]